MVKVYQVEEKEEGYLMITDQGDYQFRPEVYLEHSLLWADEVPLHVLTECKRKSWYNDIIDKTQKWLLIKPRTKKETVSFITNLQLLDSEIKQAITYLENLQLVNDEKYIDAYAQEAKKKYGPIRIIRNLEKKGIVVTETHTALKVDKDNLKKIIQKQVGKYKNDSRLAARQKLLKFSLYRGFSNSLSTSLINEVIEGTPRNHVEIIQGQVKTKTDKQPFFLDNEIERDRFIISLIGKGFEQEEIILAINQEND